MYAKNRQELKRIVKLCKKSPDYKKIMSDMTQLQQQQFVVSENQKDVKNIKFLDDSLTKNMLDISRYGKTAKNIAQTYISTYSPIKIINDIQILKNELQRPNSKAKTDILDVLFLVNGHYYVDIETQGSSIASEDLMSKLTQYGARILSGDNLKGEKKERYYKSVYVVCILDGIYHGGYKEGVKEDSMNHIKKMELNDPKYGVDKYNKLFLIIVELGKINKIYERKGLENMEITEKLSYVIKNGHRRDKKVRNNINKIAEEIPAVNDMYVIKDKQAQKFMNDFSNFKRNLDMDIQRWQVQDEEREKQRIKIYNKLIKRFKTNYNSDTEFLNGLSLDAYEEIYEMMFDNATLAEIKDYVETIE